VNNGQNIFFLIFDTVLYFFVIAVVELLRNKYSYFERFNKLVPYKPHKYDDDVQNEIDLVSKGDPKNYGLMVDKIRKVYKNGKVGVD